ncbi:MAG: hypothetical protein IJ740_11585 [Ruminococcus sp.]|nr:hypothetical protein [Ruminococcus sp.]
MKKTNKCKKAVAMFMVMASVISSAAVLPSDNGISVFSDTAITAEAKTQSYIAWRQTNEKWKKMLITPTDKNSTLAGYGCAVTSVAMNVVKAGIRTEDNFDPGKCLADLQKVGAFDKNSCISWSKVTKAYPQLKYVDVVNVSNKKKADAIEKVGKYLDKGYYIIVGVSCRKDGKCNHYVCAVSRTNDGDIKIADPGGTGQKKLSGYGKVCNIVGFLKKDAKTKDLAKNNLTGLMEAATDFIKKTNHKNMLTDGAAYRIRTAASSSKLYVGTKDNKTAKKTNVQLVKKSASSSLWVAHYNSRTNAWYFTLKNNKNVVLNLYADNVVSRTNANIYTFVSDDKTQEYVLDKISNNKFYIRNASNTNIVLDAFGNAGTQVKGTNVWSYKYNKGEKTQQWIFEKV